MSDFRTVARLEDVPPGTLVPVELDGEKIVLAHVGERVYALHDQCSHEEYPLSSGELVGDQVTCVLHGARFDLETGTPRALPAVRPVKTYQARVEGEEVQVRIG
ncbi:MAG: non-heme iron oxygenase ferredoxin subunit [Candidatus Palauibacterales bacterium]|jgi:3-phenylpropionate/trans-cinnamate dioxygenase ferredoxin component|nr:non-heme iron oxygenase ferredoxin subunit [Candidatus Palauibacterales bacterium]MDP2483644.1 non-heme iron oxygenase ferredoxin subunit [Candidatus Palauibacterales bacterium]